MAAPRLLQGPEGLMPIIQRLRPSSLWVVTDTHTQTLCLPLVGEWVKVFRPRYHVLPAGEVAKSWEGIAPLLQALMDGEADRRALLLVIGGGATTDAASFVASIYKRGIRTLLLPTTLLGMVDAAIGGKTAIDFGGIKNLLGTHHVAEGVLVWPMFLTTLPQRQVMSGFAEVVKHGLLQSEEAIRSVLASNPVALGSDEIFASAMFKHGIAEADPLEGGARRQLNFGHTFGHALEAHLMEAVGPDATTHGYCVAYGMALALVLSGQLGHMGEKEANGLAGQVAGRFDLQALDLHLLGGLLGRMANDKKAARGQHRFVLLKAPGSPIWDVPVTDEEITRAFHSVQSLIA